MLTRNVAHGPTMPESVRMSVAYVITQGYRKALGVGCHLSPCWDTKAILTQGHSNLSVLQCQPRLDSNYNWGPCLGLWHVILAKTKGHETAEPLGLATRKLVPPLACCLMERTAPPTHTQGELASLTWNGWRRAVPYPCCSNRRAGPTHGRAGPAHGRAGTAPPLKRVVWMGALIDQLSYNTGPHPGLWVSSHQYLSHLLPDRAHEGICPGRISMIGSIAGYLREISMMV